MNYDNYLLVMYWLNNVINNILNKDILLIILESSFESKKDLFKDFRNKVNLDESTYNLKIIEVDELDSFNDLCVTKKNKNIILLGYSSMDINKIYDFNCNILLSRYNEFINCELKINKDESRDIKNIILSKKHIKSSIKNCDSKYLEEKPDYYDYIKKRDTLTVIKSNDYNHIYSCIFLLFYNEKFILFNNIEVLQSNKKMNFFEWRDKINNDILVLLHDKILTSRLAVAIYRSSTLDFNKSNKGIGEYFHNQFGYGSKLTTLPRSKERLKAYSLK